MKNPFADDNGLPGVNEDWSRSDIREAAIREQFERLTTLADRKMALLALEDPVFVRRLSLVATHEAELQRQFRDCDQAIAVWRGLALLFPLTADWLIALDPLRSGSESGLAEHYLETLDQAILTQLRLVKHLEACRGMADAERLQQLDKEAEAARQGIQQIESEQLELAARVMEQESLLASLQEQQQELESRRQQSKTELKALKRKVSRAGGKLEGLKDELSELEAEMESSRQSWQEMLDRLDRAARQIDAFQSALKQFPGTEQAEQLLSDVDKLAVRIDQLRAPDRLDALKR